MPPDIAKAMLCCYRTPPIGACEHHSPRDACVLQGFFYNKFPEPKKGDLGTETDINLNQQLCYHVLGQPQSRDAVVWACPDHPAWMLGAEVTDDGRCCSIACTLPLHLLLWSAAYLGSLT